MTDIDARRTLEVWLAGKRETVGNIAEAAESVLAELARLARERDYCRERWTLAVIDWLRTRPGSVVGETDIRERAENIVAFALADLGPDATIKPAAI